MSKGLRITRRFTRADQDPYDQIEWSLSDSKITNPDGSVVFEMAGVEIPASWSQVASDIMVSKYFRKAGIPQYDEDGNQVLGRRRGAGRRSGKILQASLQPSSRNLATLGREGEVLRHFRGCRPPSRTSSATCWPPK